MEDKDIEDKVALKGILKSLDKVFSMVFVLEMVLKVTAYGPKKYLSDAWCWLDFIIVAVKRSTQYCNTTAMRQIFLYYTRTAILYVEFVVVFREFIIICPTFHTKTTVDTDLQTVSLTH